MVEYICRLLAVVGACLSSSLITAGAQPVEYVRVCDVYGSGYYYIPGTDICLRPSGRPRLDAGASGDWGWNISGSGALGTHKVESFDNKYDTGSWGWAVGAGIKLPGFIRFQADVKGESTGPYCDNCGHSSYWAVGGHVNWNPVSNFDLGVLGGYLDTTPTFKGPNSTYDFWGVEARYVTNTWMVGGQAGRLDVRDGPGSMTDAWWAELRVRLLLRALFWRLVEDEKTKFDRIIHRTAVSASIGYASGDFQNTTLKAESTQWSISADYRWAPTVRSFVTYQGIENKREPLGTVWKEHMFKTGVKIDWGTPGAAVQIEPNTPLPMVLDVVTRF